jgi:hypothetical protein
MVLNATFNNISVISCAVKEFCSSLAILKYRVVSECYFKYAQGNRNR